MKYLILLVSTIAFAQQSKSVDFLSVDGPLTIIPSSKTVVGTVQYVFTVLKPVDTIKIDAHNMTFSKLKLNGQTISFTTNGKQLLLINHFKRGKYDLSFGYRATPKQALYFVDTEKVGLT